MLCVPDAENAPAGDRLLRPYFGMHRFEWSDDESVEFHLPHGELIALLRANGFEIEELIEVRPPDGSTTRSPYATLEWAQQLADRGDLEGPPARLTGREASVGRRLAACELERGGEVAEHAIAHRPEQRDGVADGVGAGRVGGRGDRAGHHLDQDLAAALAAEARPRGGRRAGWRCRSESMTPARRTASLRSRTSS